MNQGGAKAGIKASQEIEPEERRTLLVEFGKAILPFIESRRFIPGPDLGTKYKDISMMLSDIGVKVRPKSSRGLFDSGYYTALSVFISSEEASRLCGGDLKSFKVAIEGFGAVGSSLAMMFNSAGAKVVAISTINGAVYNPDGLNVSELIEANRKERVDVVESFQGGEKIPREQLLELPVDILCPCANLRTLHRGNANLIKAKIIAPGANLPIAEDVEPILFSKNIFSVPHFVANCGGVLSGSMKSGGLNHNSIFYLFNTYLRKKIIDLLKRSVSTNKMPLEVVMGDIAKRIEKLKENPQRSRGRLINFSKKCVRRGIIPAFLLQRISFVYFKKILLKQKL